MAALKGAAWTHISRSVEETEALAARLGAELRPGAVLALEGELGSGKTAFVRGLAQGLGVLEPDEVVSPTYTLVNEYPARRCTLVHIDLYRLREAAAAHAAGIDEAFYRDDAVVAIEWADVLRELLPPDPIWCRLARVDASTRSISVHGLDRPVQDPGLDIGS